MIGTVGLPQLLIIVLIIFFIFGAKRLPDMGKGIGEGIRNFKRSLKAAENDAEETKSREA